MFWRLPSNLALVSFASEVGSPLSDVHGGNGEYRFHAVHSSISWRVCPELPSNGCGHLLSRLRIGDQPPTADWWFSGGPQPAVSSEMADELDGGGRNVVVQKRKE